MGNFNPLSVLLTVMKSAKCSAALSSNPLPANTELWMLLARHSIRLPWLHATAILHFAARHVVTSYYCKARTHTHTHAHIHTCRHAGMHAGTRAHAHTPTHTRTHAYVYEHTHTHTHIHTHTHTHTHTHAYTHIHTRARTQTHITLNHITTKNM